MGPDRSYLTTSEAAHRLALSPRTLEAWRLNGGGPSYCKLGRAVRYAVEDLKAFAAAREQGSTSMSASPSPRLELESVLERKPRGGRS